MADIDPQSSGSESPEETAESTSPGTEEATGPRRTPLIVGIGASAGGLESLRKFFRQVPPESGIAYVVVVHLLPDHKSLMPELLQRDTRIPVVQITDLMPLERNRVHIIPPDHRVTLHDGRFRLTRAEREIPLAQIDLFFTSLAETHGESAVGVVLSGAGSDGAQGIRVIKEHLGIAIAESPETARYSSMPEASISTGLIDRILPAEDIPAYLVELSASQRIPVDLPPEDQSADLALHRIFFALRSKTGHDFSGYKRNTIQRRIERRMFLHHIGNLTRYAEFLQSNAAEAEGLFKDLLIGVTRFFRDPESFALLKSEILPAILEDKPESATVRVWVPGVATGEEAYSIAILLMELREELKKSFKIQIFATDIDSGAIECARLGRYPAGITEDVNPERLHRFFEKEGDLYRIRRAVRESIIFAEQNVIKDPPFTRLDLLSCRNLLIYLNTDLQHRLLPLFHYSLRPHGFLMLGASESIGDHGPFFDTIDAKWRIFRVREGTGAPGPVFDHTLPAAPSPRSLLGPERRDDTSLHRLTSRILLERFAPPAVIIDPQGHVLFVHGSTGRFLEPAPGRENTSILDMARPGLRLHLPPLIREATLRGEEVTRHGIEVKINGGETTVDVSIRPVKGKDPKAALFMITFEEVPAEVPPATEHGSRPATAQDVEILEAELRHARENLQTAVEELEASNEELRSINEEYQSTNEELKSTNEELETSREELQSVNEELATINREMEEKMEELTRSNKEVTSFLNSLGVPTVFVDTELRLRRFTTQARELINVIESDLGRPLSDITYRLEDKELVTDARRVLDSMVYQEKEVRTTDGHWYLRRIIPYRAADDKVVGVVINFVDIHELKEKSIALDETRRKLEYTDLMVQTLRQALVLLDENLNIESVNRPFFLLVRAKKEDVIGKSIFDVGKGQIDAPEFRQMVERLQSPSEHTDMIELEMDFPSLGRKRVIVYARRLFIGEKNQVRFLLEIDPID